MTIRHFTALVVLISLLSLSCSHHAKPVNPPNIIWLVAEDISPALGCYGDRFATTPNIDALAAQRIVYDNAFATAPICAPSRSCLMSGLYATSLGTHHLRCEIPFPEKLKTLPELLHQAGYFTSNRDKTDYNFNPQNRWELWSSTITPWRQRTDERPFFCFINIGPSHEGSVNNEERFASFTQDLDPSLRHDPAKVSVPPYYPDNEQARLIWAHYYDIMIILDQNVGAVLDSLEKDGLMDETIIFFFGDHGFGMPRYKRWLYRTGLQVPLIVYLPQKYDTLTRNRAGTHSAELVSFVDFMPTVLNCAGVDVPDDKEGQPFLGRKRAPERKYIFGARDRADDMFEMSRAVSDGRYIYIRHFMPHLPYIQSGYIYSDVKHAFRVLIQAYTSGELNAEQMKLWQHKPTEELYDWQCDPHELSNLANESACQQIKAELAGVLHDWMIEHHDLGLLPEAEYMLRSQGTTPYEYARESGDFLVADILAAAEMIGTTDEQVLLEKLDDADSGVRYWAVIGLQQLTSIEPETWEALHILLNDPSPSVQIAAAEVLCTFGDDPEAINRLGYWVQDDRPTVALQAARAIQLIGEDARPLLPFLYKVLYKNLGEPGGRLKYKDYNYAAFTSWALEWALQELGEEIKVN
ncbi:sulfatase-like hydrolase/transferase [candidate division KSB1 bacterium]|nr:sulfatase-like hydrolase/transferase [candidate division KSB1 bacterium]